MGRKTAGLAKARSIPPPERPDALDELDADDVSGGADDQEIEPTAEDGLDVEAASTDNIGEQSVEINVESLIAELEADSHEGPPADMKCARRKLDDYLERKRIAQELEDFEDFVVED